MLWTVSHATHGTRTISEGDASQRVRRLDEVLPDSGRTRICHALGRRCSQEVAKGCLPDAAGRACSILVHGALDKGRLQHDT